MMKVRYIPFGYKYENGQKVINEKESVAVIEIFTRYLKREGVMAIANDLTERRIEYMPNEFEWNKSRVLRVVKDARYIGENKFPPIIDKPTFNTVQALYNEKRTVLRVAVERIQERLCQIVDYCGKLHIHPCTILHYQGCRCGFVKRRI